MLLQKYSKKDEFYSKHIYFLKLFKKRAFRDKTNCQTQCTYAEIFYFSTKNAGSGRQIL
jgi:hypothetical protein